MQTKTLKQLGLTEEQARVYSALINHGSIPARKIALETQLKRSLVYKILKQLIALGLAEEEASLAKVSKFSALHPSNLEKMVDQKREEFNLANSALDEAMGIFGSQYNLTHHKPNVRFYEGVSGLKILHQDILRDSHDIRLIRSHLDNDTPELAEIVSRQVEKQVAKNIHTRVIAPTKKPPGEWTAEEVKAKDEKNLVTRCRVPREKLDIPAQVIIYGDKTAFTSFRDQDNLVTTIIEDKGITETCSALFEHLWEKYQENITK